MSLIRVPRWMFAKSHESGGLRLPKRLHLEIPHVHNSMGFHRSESKVEAECYNEKEKLVLKDALMDFEHWEYRFWSILFVNDKPMCAECRCCGAVLTAKEPRKTHSNVNECFRKLTNAYNSLLKDMKCVVCDNHTHSKNWGVPICSPRCLDDWMHVTAQPDALMYAIQLTGGNKEGAIL